MKRSLPRRSQHLAEMLRLITEEIRELVGDDLAMLILFGSYARGDWVDDRYVEGRIVYSYQSDFDVLLITQNRSQSTQRGADGLTHAITRRLHRRGLRTPTTSVIVEDIKYVNKQLERGHYFFTDIKKEGVLLYDSGLYKLARRRRLNPKELQKYAREDYRYWFRSASGFLASALANLDKRRPKLTAFELHQATERFLHTVVLTFSRTKPRTHDIEKLDRRASNLHADFFTVFPRATKQQKRRFDLLKRAYIDARYKPAYKITKPELEYLASRVRKLQRLTRKICREKIKSFAPGE